MKLTREKAIAEHRKMWNWIADQLEDGVACTISQLKNIYCKMDRIHLLDDCFCCEYARSTSYRHSCESCPILWGSENKSQRFYCEYEANGDMNKGLWWSAQEKSLEKNYMEAAKIARQIANLPEKPVKKTED